VLIPVVKKYLVESHGMPGTVISTREREVEKQPPLMELTCYRERQTVNEMKAGYIKGNQR
jgi:hypothetical protein